MKKIIPVVLILLMLTLIAFSFINKDKRDVVLEEEVIEEEEIYYADVKLPEDTRLLSNYEVIDLDKVLQFIDPSEMQNYDDLLTLYATYLPMTTNSKADSFYKLNKDSIQQLLGIYSLEDYLTFSDKLMTTGIDVDSLANNIEIVDIVKEDNLLKSTVKINYNNASFTTTHYINYLYIGKEPYLYLYTLSEVL